MLECNTDNLIHNENLAYYHPNAVQNFTFTKYKHVNEPTIELEPKSEEQVENKSELEELNKKIQAMMEKVDNVWTCLACGKTATDESKLTIHVEATHIEGFFHPCKGCGKVFS